ncbi:MAG: glycosyltransferase family 2 protein [Dehalococcoidia bacterium]
MYDRYIESLTAPADLCAAVTVLVPTNGRTEQLNRCIQSIVNNRYTCFRVVVLDQTEDTRRLDIRDNRNVEHVFVSQKGKARALNFGLNFADTPFIALTDDDTVVDENWIQRGVDALCCDKGIGLIFGSVNPAPEPGDDSFIPSFMPQEAKEIVRASAIAIPGVGMGANMFARTQAVRSIGGWDAALGPGSHFRSGDDWDLAFRMAIRGFKVGVSPGPAVTHWGSRSLSNGAASTLIYNNFYGVGAGAAKFVRSGELAIVPAAAKTLAKCAWDVFSSVVHSGRPRHARRFLALSRGFREGWTVPIDTSARKFVDTAMPHESRQGDSNSRAESQKANPFRRRGCQRCGIAASGETHGTSSSRADAPAT